MDAYFDLSKFNWDNFYITICLLFCSCFGVGWFHVNTKWCYIWNQPWCYKWEHGTQVNCITLGSNQFLNLVLFYVTYTYMFSKGCVVVTHTAHNCWHACNVIICFTIIIEICLYVVWVQHYSDSCIWWVQCNIQKWESFQIQFFLLVMYLNTFKIFVTLFTTLS